MRTTKRAPVPPAGFPPLRYDLAERAEQASRADGPWSMSHLKVPSLAMLALAVLGFPLGLWLGGWPAAWGVLLGTAIVAGFFSLSTYVVAKAGEIDPRFTLTAALVTYGIKLVILGILLAAFPLEGPISRFWVGGAIGVGIVVWLACQVTVVIRTPRMYVDLSATVPEKAPAAPAKAPVATSPDGVSATTSDTEHGGRP